MDRAIKIKNLAPLDDTAIQILRIISLKIGDKGGAFVPYMQIAKSLNLDRDTVAKSVKKMIKRGILKEVKGELTIPDSVLVMG